MIRSVRDQKAGDLLGFEISTPENDVIGHKRHKKPPQSSYLKSSKGSKSSPSFAKLESLTRAQLEEKKRKIETVVDPKVDEDLLELMVKIAEDPTQWRHVHNALRKSNLFEYKL